MQPFAVVEPEDDSPVLVEVPHAGTWLDPVTLGHTVAPAYCVGRDADLHVDALFAKTPSVGATLLAAHSSRYVADLNRGELDYDAHAVEGGPEQSLPRGLIWRLTTDGAPILRHPLPIDELQRRLTWLYRPYHEQLGALLDRKRERFGAAILLCAHSMPTFARRSRLYPGARRADLVPGTRGRTTASGDLIDLVDAHARESGLSVRHDDPYRGGFSTGHYGRPAEGLHAIQVEISRGLYMNEETLAQDPAGFERIATFATSLVQRLVGEGRAIISNARPQR